MKTNNLKKLGSSLLAVLLLQALASCAPAESPQTTLSPPGSGQLQFPGGPNSPYTSDFSQVSSQYSTAITNLLGGYTVSVQIEPSSTNNSRIVRTALLTLTRHQNTQTAGAVQAWGSLDIVLTAAGGLPEVKKTAYLGVNPNPLYGRYFQFSTPAFSMPELSDAPIALQLYLAFNAQFQFDGTASGIISKDCSLSGGVICTNSSLDLVFGNDLRRR